MIENIIDCHTHLQSEKLIDEYFSGRKGCAIAIKALDSLIGNGDKFYEATKKYDNVFICECIDAFGKMPISEQLKNIEKNLEIYKVIGLKIYLGYQAIFADDKRLFPVYEFARKHNLSVVFHCGVGASNLYSDNSKNYASSLPIGNVAKKFPSVNFIASHFDWPNFDDCLKVITENPNVFTDISGEYENFEGKPYSELIKSFISQIKPHLDKFKPEDIVKKIMFGTDYFGKGSGFDAVEEYIETLEKLFSKKYEKLYLFENCKNAYPKINEYLKCLDDKQNF